MSRVINAIEFLARKLFSPNQGCRYWQVGDSRKVESLIRPLDGDVVAIYTVHNQWQLKQAIAEIPEGHGLYDPVNDAYVLRIKFLWDFDENQDPDKYCVPMIKAVSE